MELYRFSEIVGQTRAIGILSGSMGRERIPHAYLFTGMPGVGKTAAAKAFAFVLNCDSPKGMDACGSCRSCRKMASGNYPDYREISPEKGVIKIETIREVTREFQYAPLEGRYRFTVIREGDKMTVEAANAFLKTLEEPPNGNILVVTATEPLDLLPTVVSRCQRVPFIPIAKKDIEQWLQTKRLGANDMERSAVARFSKGSIGQAKRIIESQFMEKRIRWIEHAERLPALGYGELLDIARDCADQDKKQLLDSEEGGESALVDLLGVWATWFRDLLVFKTTGQEDMLMNPDLMARLKACSGSFTAEGLIDIIYLLHQAERDLRKNRSSILMAQHIALYLKDRADLKENKSYVG